MVKTLGIEQFAPMNHIYRFYELNDYMKSIAEIGYHSMDLWTCGSHYFVDSNNYEDTKYIKKLMSQYDIRIVSITPRQSCPNPFHMAVKKTELREKAKQYFQNMILAAHELSCPKLLITSGWQSYSETRQEAWDRSVWMVGELCRFAEKYGVSLTMETLSRQSTTLVNTISDLKQMMKEVNSKAFTITADETDEVTVDAGNFVNTKLSSLPSTGGMGTYLFTIIGVVVMAGAAGAFFISRRKGSEE